MIKNKRVKIIGAIIFLILIINVQANTINITIDSITPDLCLSINNLTYYTCNSSIMLELDGTNDYEYYLITKPSVKDSSNMTQVLKYSMITPLNIILVLGGLLMSGVVIVIFVTHMIKWLRQFSY